MWLGAESNRRHEDFQSSALPTELPSRLLISVSRHIARRVLIKAENAQPSMPSCSGGQLALIERRYSKRATRSSLALLAMFLQKVALQIQRAIE